MHFVSYDNSWTIEMLLTAQSSESGKNSVKLLMLRKVRILNCSLETFHNQIQLLWYNLIDFLCLTSTSKIFRWNVIQEKNFMSRVVTCMFKRGFLTSVMMIPKECMLTMVYASSSISQRLCKKNPTPYVSQRLVQKITDSELVSSV